MRDQQYSESAQEQQRHDWLLYSTYSEQPHALYGTCPGSTSERKQEWILTDPSSNFTLNRPEDFARFTTRSNIRGNIPFRKIDCKQDISNENVGQIYTFPERIRNFQEPIHIWDRTDKDTNQYFIAPPADLDVHAAGG